MHREVESDGIQYEVALNPETREATLVCIQTYQGLEELMDDIQKRVLENDQHRLYGGFVSSISGISAIGLLAAKFISSISTLNSINFDLNSVSAGVAVTSGYFLILHSIGAFRFTSYQKVELEKALKAAQDPTEISLKTEEVSKAPQV